MKSRQLLSDVQDGTFGVSYYSQSQQKIALVGTLAKVKSKKILDDGRTLAVIECLDRFYVEEVTSETPYLKARVRPFKDYSETPTVLDDLERKVFDDVRCNFKFMKLLLPQKNYTMSSGLLLNRPPSSDPGTRIINLASQSVEKERRAKFSYAVLEMLQISNPTKLSLLQVILLLFLQLHIHDLTLYYRAFSCFNSRSTFQRGKKELSSTNSYTWCPPVPLVTLKFGHCNLSTASISIITLFHHESSE